VVVFPRASVLLLMAGGLLGACSDGLTDPAKLPVGSFNGRWDGAAWHGRSFAVLTHDTLFVFGHRPDPQYYYDEYIQARVVFTGRGSYFVPESAGQLAKITGGDAGYLPSAEGTLIVSGYDPNAGTLVGELTLTANHDGATWRARGAFHTPVYASFLEVPPVRNH
jgi:hypothetical protein